MMRKILLGCFFFLCMGLAWAEQDPVAMLQNASDQMMTELRNNHQKVDTDPHFVYDLTRRIVLPYVDVKAMSRLALGRDNWKQASPTQRDEFVKEFTELLIRTYATALAAYTNETIKFQPLRKPIANNKRLQVNSLIYQHGGPAIPVNYRLLLRNGTWKVYDLTVDGVSMIQSFSSQFSSTIAQSGMDGLLSEMNKHGTKF